MSNRATPYQAPPRRRLQSVIDGACKKTCVRKTDGIGKKTKVTQYVLTETQMKILQSILEDMPDGRRPVNTQMADQLARIG